MHLAGYIGRRVSGLPGPWVAGGRELPRNMGGSGIVPECWELRVLLGRQGSRGRAGRGKRVRARRAGGSGVGAFMSLCVGADRFIPSTRDCPEALRHRNDNYSQGLAQRRIKDSFLRDPLAWSNADAVGRAWGGGLKHEETFSCAPKKKLHGQGPPGMSLVPNYAG